MQLPGAFAAVDGDEDGTNSNVRAFGVGAGVSRVAGAGADPCVGARTAKATAKAKVRVAAADCTRGPLRAYAHMKVGRACMSANETRLPSTRPQLTRNRAAFQRVPYCGHPMDGVTKLPFDPSAGAVARSGQADACAHFGRRWQ